MSSKFHLGFLKRLVISGSLVIHQQAAGQWIPQTLPQGIGWRTSVDFIDLNVGASAGASGSVVYTTNGGMTWSIANVPDSTRALLALQFVDAHTGYAAGFKGGLIERFGVFLRTTDGGQNWEEPGTLPDSVFVVRGMSFVNDQIGFLIADEAIAWYSAKMMQTTNGGLTWVRLTLPDSIWSLESLVFVDSLHGLASGFLLNTTAILLETTDGGSTWVQKSAPVVFLDIHFVDRTTGFAVAGPRIYKTTNGGSQWSHIATAPDTVWLSGIRFASNSATGIVFGYSHTHDTLITVPFIGKTTNGGVNWDFQTLAGFAPWTILAGGKMINDSIAYICGGVNGGLTATMLHTTNGGATFVPPHPREIVGGYHLAQNYPNPFNPKTSFRFQVSSLKLVTLKVFDLLGREVETLVNEVKEPGIYEVEWDATEHASGVYFCRLTSGSFTQTRKLLLLR